MFVMTTTYVWAQPDERLVRVGVYQNAPQVFIEDDGAPRGIYIDILNEVARLENWRLEFVPGTFASGLDAVRNGRIDVMTSIAATPDRDEYIDFSKETVVSVWAQLYVRPDFSPQNILDMQDTRVTVLRDGILGRAFDKLCKGFDVTCQIIPVDSYDHALQAIDDGLADGAVVNSILGFSRETNYAAKRSSIVFSPFRLQIAVPEERNADITAALDRHLAAWRKDKNSFYFQTLDRWLGLKQEEKNVIPVWIWWTLGAGGVFILLFFSWNATLRHEVTQRKRAEMSLALAKDEAEAANRAKSEFLAAMSHDLRTPLNAIMGFAQMMEMRTFGELGDPHYEKYAKDIHDSGTFLVSMINDILDLSKVEAGKYVLSERDIDMKAFFEDVTDMTQPLAQEKNIALVLEYASRPPILRADERVMTQVLNNLLSNAIKFTAEGGRITIRSWIGPQGNLSISVSDNGQGMSQDDIAKALQPFEQVNSNQAQKQEGTGLGLYLCQKLVGLHGGSILIKSEIDTGTEVVVKFPPHRVVRKD